jgi:hypothetical protein
MAPSDGITDPLHSGAQETTARQELMRAVYGELRRCV